ncbi:MAG: CFI-box-CTERM domain-containing protein [Candidatus Saccharibacteria bacterium]
MGRTDEQKSYDKGYAEGSKAGVLERISEDATRGVFDRMGVSKNEKARQEGYDKGWDNTNGDNTSSGGGGSSCYITTACVGYFGLPDDCQELRVLRRFRDRVLLPTPAGRRAVKEYYQVAPELVAAVAAHPMASRIWQKVYGQIQQAVKLVRMGSFDQAFRHYQAMTKELQHLVG